MSFLHIIEALITAAGCVSIITVKWKFVMFIAVWLRLWLIYLTAEFHPSCFVSFHPLWTDTSLQTRRRSSSGSVVRG